MNRQESAYFTPAALIVGLAAHNFLGSIYALYQRRMLKNQGSIWYTSLITMISLGLLIFFQMMVLDFLTSPYQVPDWFIGFAEGGISLFHFLTSFGVSTVLMIRLSFFYQVFSMLIVRKGQK